MMQLLFSLEKTRNLLSLMELELKLLPSMKKITAAKIKQSHPSWVATINSKRFSHTLNI